MTSLAKRVGALEQRAGAPGPCACRLRIAVVYDDVPVGDDSPVSPVAVASPLCPHGRPWRGVDVDVEHGDGRAR